MVSQQIPAQTRPVNGYQSSNSYNEYDDEKDSSSEGVDIPQFYSGENIESQNPPQVLHLRSEIVSLDDQNEIARIMSGSESEHKTAIPEMGDGRPRPPGLPDVKQYQVDFNGPDDPNHPFNWTSIRKLRVSASLALCSLTSTWGSSIYSIDNATLSQIFHVKPVVISLGISLYVLGFAAGPIFWSPLSELYGRKLPIVLSMLLFTCFTFATATGMNLQTVLICRFFSGLCGSAPLTVVAAAFADIYNNKSRGIAIDIFAMTVFCGPLLSPIVGGFVVESYLGWRWTLYITGILAGLSLLASVFLIEETYAPIILVKKAEIIRQRTDNWGVHAAHERVAIDLEQIITKNITRPIMMLVTEPIILLISVYNGFCYAILYLSLSSYPYTFTTKYKWPLEHSTLPYIGILVGMCINCTLLMTYYERNYNKLVDANGGQPVPEGRLEPMKPAGVIFGLGLIWFFWSANYPEHVHWAVPTVSGIFTGYGLMGLFVPSINYIVDAYLFFAASAMASLTFLRSLMGAASPLFAVYMFEGIGLNWSGLILGLVALALAPVPFLFAIYGKKLRAKSKFALGNN